MSKVSLSQDGRWLRLDTPLGRDVVVIEELEGHEALSRLFSFRLRGLAARTFGAADLVGREVVVTTARYQGEKRLMRGMVSEIRFGQSLRSGYRRFELTIEPSFAVLRHASDYRVFQEKSVTEIATAVFNEQGLSNFRFDIVGAKAPRAYCVQFGETDLAFIERLFEEEGYFYFFEHDAETHTLVVSDSAVKYMQGGEPLLYSDGSVEGERLVQSLSLVQRLADTGWTFRQFDAAAPATPVDGSSETKLSRMAAASRSRRFSYGVGEPLAARQKAVAGRNVDTADAEAEAIEGTSTAISLMPGLRFSLSSRSHDDVALLDGSVLAKSGFVVTAIDHRLVDPSWFNSRPKSEGKPTYTNRFHAIPASRVLRPRSDRVKPRAYGPQTATVVGPAGSEVHTDKEGRIRVQFHWDRRGKKDEQSSCFIRVAQAWAGNGWGTQFVPRVGMEVVVQFLDGDPDKPLISGALYNGANAPPFPLPAQMNKSGLRTRSTRQGDTGTFSELSIDDTKGTEVVLLHAQKDMNQVVENDERLEVGHDQTLVVKNNRTATVSEGNETLSVRQGNRSVTIEQGDDALTLGGGDLSISLQGGDMRVELGAGSLFQRCSAGRMTLEALQGITLKCGQSTIELTPKGVVIQGLAVSAKASTKAELVGLMTDVKGSGMTQVSGGLVKIN